MDPLVWPKEKTCRFNTTAMEPTGTPRQPKGQNQPTTTSRQPPAIASPKVVYADSTRISASTSSPQDGRATARREGAARPGDVTRSEG